MCSAVVKCQSDTDEAADIVEVSEDVSFGDGQHLDTPFSSAPGIHAICLFPKNPTRCKC